MPNEEQAQPTSRHTLYVPKSTNRRQGFIKTVTAVDPSKKDEYAFDGEFIKNGVETDLPVGEVVVKKIPMGSGRNPEFHWQHALAPPEGTNWEWSERYLGTAFLTFRDDVAQQVKEAEAKRYGFEGSETSAGQELQSEAPDQEGPVKNRPGGIEGANQRRMEMVNTGQRTNRSADTADGVRFYQALEQAAAGHPENPVRLDRQAMRFRSGQRKNPEGMREANRFLKVLVKACPDAVRLGLDWTGTRLSATLDRDELFLAMFGTTAGELREAVAGLPGGGGILDRPLSAAAEETLRLAYTEVDALIEALWAETEERINAFGMQAGETGKPAERMLVPMI